MAKSWREIFEFDKEIEQKEQETQVMAIESLMETLKFTPMQAMDALKIPSDKRDMYAKLVKGM